MTWRNAHQYLKKVYLTTKNDSFREALSVALAALRGPTREQVERMRYPWERITDAYGNTEGFLCECGHMDNSASNFCKYCGLPKTDEAVEIVVERLEALHEAN